MYSVCGKYNYLNFQTTTIKHVWMHGTLLSHGVLNTKQKALNQWMVTFISTHIRCGVHQPNHGLDFKEMLVTNFLIIAYLLIAVILFPKSCHCLNCITKNDSCWGQLKRWWKFWVCCWTSAATVSYFISSVAAVMFVCWAHPFTAGHIWRQCVEGIFV